MRNILLASAAAPALLYALPAQAQNCTAAPDCATLGYTKNQTQCSGKIYTRCPFDTSKYNCDDSKAADCASLGYTDKKEYCPGNFVSCPTDEDAVRCQFDAKPGDLKYSLRTADHDGWLLCNGTTYDKKKWPELYAVIGDTFGNKLPNYSGYFLKGAATSSQSTFKTSEAAGLPNITGQITGLRNEGVNVSGAIQMTYGSASGKHSSGGSKYTFTFDASKSNSIYGRSSTVTPANYKANIFIFAGRKMSAQTTCEKNGYYSSMPKGEICDTIKVGSTTCYTDCNVGTMEERCRKKYSDSSWGDYNTSKRYPDSEGWCYSAQYEDCGTSQTPYSESEISDTVCKDYADELIRSCFLDEQCMSSQYGIGL